MDYGFFLKGIEDITKCLGTLECSPEIFYALESYDEKFLNDLVSALSKFTKIANGKPTNKFARYDTYHGNIILYTKMDYNNRPYTNILFAKEVI